MKRPVGGHPEHVRRVGCRAPAARRCPQSPFRPPGPAAEFTVYERPDYGQRQLGDQRCENCRAPSPAALAAAVPTRIPTSPWPVTDLLVQAVITTTNRPPPSPPRLGHCPRPKPGGQFRGSDHRRERGRMASLDLRPARTRLVTLAATPGREESPRHPEIDPGSPPVAIRLATRDCGGVLPS